MKLEIHSIKKRYGKKRVLEDITFSAESGSCIGILGSNGCGKSTLLSILAGVQKCNSGRMILQGNDLFKNSSLHRKNVGYVPQGIPLMEELSAKDNLKLWYTREQLKKELKDGILKTLGINEFLNVPVRKMSGGMKKRLSIGCAVSGRPAILLLDEPTAALDLVCKEDICQYLYSYKNAGGILILTTHDASELVLCDKWYIIKDGRLVEFNFDGNIRKLTESL